LQALFPEFIDFIKIKDHEKIKCFFIAITSDLDVFMRRILIVQEDSQDGYEKAGLKSQTRSFKKT
jgi:hypothetical protein